MRLLDNKPLVRAKLADDGTDFRHLPETYRDDKELALVAVGASGLALEWVSRRLQCDRELVLAAAQHPEFNCLGYASAKLLHDKDILRAAARSGLAKVCFHAPDALKADPELAREVVAYDGLQTQWIHGAALQCPIVHANAVAQNGRALQWVPKALKTKALVLAAVRNDGTALRWATHWRSDEEVVRAAMGAKSHGESPLRWAQTPQLTNDVAFMLEAVQQQAGAILFAGGLREDVSFVRAAARVSPEVLAKVPNAIAAAALRGDRALAFDMVSKSANALAWLPDELCADKELLLCALRTGSAAIHWAPFELKKDADIVSAALKHRSGMRDYMLAVLQSEDCCDKAVMMQAVAVCGITLHYACDALCADPEVVLAAVTRDGNALRFASAELRADPKIVLAAVRQEGEALAHARQDSDPWRATPPRVRREVYLAAVQNWGDALKFVPAEFRSDLSIVCAALPTMSLCTLPWVKVPDNPFVHALVAQVAARAPTPAFEAALCDAMEQVLEAAAAVMPHLPTGSTEVVESLVATLMGPHSVCRKRDRDAFEAGMGGFT